jgi:hypothetical protein
MRASESVFQQAEPLNDTLLKYPTFGMIFGSFLRTPTSGIVTAVMRAQ